jgi:hypothetical protein
VQQPESEPCRKQTLPERGYFQQRGKNSNRHSEKHFPDLQIYRLNRHKTKLHRRSWSVSSNSNENLPGKSLKKKPFEEFSLLRTIKTFERPEQYAA